jgi:2'-5' RNA ligase
MRAGSEPLGRLAAQVDAALVARGWPAETRPFRAHLTLARSDGVAAGAQIGARLQQAAEALEIGARIDRIGLFESLTGGGPARYVPLEMVGLRGPTEAG